MALTRESDIRRFNRWAPTYDTSILQRWFFGPVHSEMLDLLGQNKLAAPPRRILDVGCGTGRLLRAASARWPQAELFGVDPAEQMISEARRLNPNATFMVAAAESLPIPDRSIDLVMSSLSFHHWIDQAKGLREIVRVLYPGGLFCLADHSFLPANLFHARARGRKAIRALMEAGGLRVLSQKRLPLRFVLITVAQK